MAMILWHLLVLGIAFLLLAWGAERFVQGALGVSTHLGLSPLMAGVVLVGFTTSFPEMLVSLLAAYQGQPGLSLGNALGSYVTNIGLGIGLIALWVPLRVHSQLLTRELPLLVLSFLLSAMTLLNGHLSRGDGVILLLGLTLLLTILARLTLRPCAQQPADNWAEKATQTSISSQRLPCRTALFQLLLGCAVLLLSSHWLVQHGVALARAWGISDLIIGLTVIAFGTSIPEVAASWASVLKDEPDMAIGNVLGSNMLGILAVTAMPALCSPGPIEPAVIWRDVPIMGLMTLVLVAFMLPHQGICYIGRTKGAVLLGIWILYLWLLAPFSTPPAHAGTMMDLKKTSTAPTLSNTVPANRGEQLKELRKG